ncbi:LANO_0H08724g1_1 [Lachancea nothofagi CBS 11611]|uniref:LANO_0H08724g1_1 n=1 Tax=Lachancea nothofagi CBS 11611 TaxID=1266666 RepID=A0A1G4KM06_9SACH|nr:LANO_0H08724g1_1 [Lachancea nothofagi CBS 11611]
MDFSIPPGLPVKEVTKLQELTQEYHDGDVTMKGYNRKRQEILERGGLSGTPIGSPTSNVKRYPGHARNHSLASTVRSRRSQTTPQKDNYTVDTSSLLSSRQNSLSMYKVTTRNSSSLNSKASPIKSLGESGAAEPTSPIYKPMVPLLPRTESAPMSDSLPYILRARSQLYEREAAFISINYKNKENAITWDKLYLRAERVAYELTKHKLYKMAKVLLWFNKDDLVEFTVSLLGCFIAGMVAVPVSLQTYSLSEITQIVGLTSATLSLISEDCLKQIDHLEYGDNSKIKLTKNGFLSQMTFVMTEDLGIYSKAKKNKPTFDIPNVSYIEFTRTPLGRLSGVVIKHKILTKQLETMASILNSRRQPHWTTGDVKRSYKNRRTNSRYTVLSSLDPTRSTGLIFGVLFNIFTGNLLLTVDDRLLQQAGLYENIINKHRVNILLNDQLQLKQVVINYLDNPAMVTSKKNKIDMCCVKWCLTSCTNIDTEVTDMIVHKWLKNLGCLDASQCYSPMLTLLDFGGVFISLRDQLGHLENFPIHDPKLRLQDELFIDKEQLKENVVKPSITAMINSSSSTKDYLRLSCFGFPIPDATVCIVNPDDSTLVPDLTIGELWISSPSITDEFYQMDKINEFVFNARLNFKKMTDILKWTVSSTQAIKESFDRLDMIMEICSPGETFIRTKLMGFVHNGKIYVLSLIEDMFLQNKLIRLPNWSHTSDVTRAKALDKARNTESAPKKEVTEKIESLKSKRIVQTYYLQHVTENVVRMVDKALEVSVFELPQNKEEHFLIMAIESPLASNPSAALVQSNLSMATQQKQQLEKKMTAVVEQIYKILWIFHRIQPLCILLVAPGSLPRRYCSLEIANSTVEKRFLSGLLNSKFVKFQVDNVILDFIPHSSFVNESIFSEHLSTLRHDAIAQDVMDLTGSAPGDTWQTSGIDYREKSLDYRTNTDLTPFPNILEILEWRSRKHGDEHAFSDGVSSASSSAANSNSFHSKVSWKSFLSIIGCFVKKIVQSKTPLKTGDHVIVLCDNSVEYVAMVLACFYCNLVVIPIATLNDSHPVEEVDFLLSVVLNYKVRRIFVDSKMQAILDDGTDISRALKRYKHLIPKITTFSKIKKKADVSFSSLKALLKEKHGTNSVTSQGCVVWIDRERDNQKEINVVMTHKILLNMCKIIKETLQLTSDSPLISTYMHTAGLGFIQSCLLGIYVGTTTSFFNFDDILSDATSFLIALQNLNVKDLILSPEMLYAVLDQANSIVQKGKSMPSGRKDSKSAKPVVRPDFLRKVMNIMIPSKGRPRTMAIQNTLKKYPSIMISPAQLNYVYQHIFNPLISLRSYLGIPPVDIYLDPVSLREGMVREVDPNTLPIAELDQYLHLQDSGIVPVCTDLSIVNPETLQPCYENEIGELWCCSEANVYDYNISQIMPAAQRMGVAKNKSSRGSLTKLPFISAQFKSKLGGEADNGLSYLRTGDLGFIKNIRCTDSRDSVLSLSVLYVLGSINETIEVLGLTHFVTDLETTVKNAHACVYNCLVAKVGGLVSCVVECRGNKTYEYSNLTPLIVAALLERNGVVLDLCCFIKPRSINYAIKNWQNNRMTILSDWVKGKLKIETQFGINYGENNAIYLLSDFDNRL